MSAVHRGYNAIDDDYPSTQLSNSQLPRNDFREASRWEAGRGRVLRWVTIAAVSGLALGAISSKNLRVDKAPASSSTLQMETRPSLGSINSKLGEARAPSTSSLAFTALNFYHERDGKPGQDYPWLKDVKLIEPHRDTTLSVTNPRDGFEYVWGIREGKIGQAGQGHAVTATGAEAVIILKHLHEHVVTLQEVNSLGEVTSTREEEVMVKYVRREIRTLSHDERGELLDAMFKLWSVSVKDGKGKELYGENYADIWGINRLHFMGATGHGECDHFHDGLGFFVSHVLVTNTFEYSLQLVNPKLTVPYWEFTVESSSQGLSKYVESMPETRSPLLQTSWFGSSDPIDHVVKDGRWAYTEIPKVEENNPAGLDVNVYGQLRAPWNVNNNKYMTRGMGKLCTVSVADADTWPTCEIDYEAVASYSNYYSWGWNISGLPHGSIHQWLGGAFNCDEMYDEISTLVGAFYGKKLAEKAMIYRKEMFCDGMFKCEGKVDLDVAPEEVFEKGICGCLDYDLTQGDDYLVIRSALDNLESYIGDFDADTQRQVVSLICSGATSYGEHTESDAALDPTFWPIHPTLERMFEFAVLTETLTDFSWPDSDITYTNSDGSTTTEILSSTGADCLGHRGSDVFPFGLLERDSTDFEIKTSLRNNPVTGNNLTNREVLQALDPRFSSKNYIYDSFTWEHCAADGVLFKDIWENASAQ